MSRHRAAKPGGGSLGVLPLRRERFLPRCRALSQVPNLGASGAIAAVLGSHLVLYPTSRVFTWVVVWVVRIPAYLFLGGWFVYQLVEANWGLPARPPRRRRALLKQITELRAERVRGPRLTTFADVEQMRRQAERRRRGYEGNPE